MEEEAAYLVLVNVNQYNHLGNRLYTLRLRAHALGLSGSTLGINSLEASAMTHQDTRMLPQYYCNQVITAGINPKSMKRRKDTQGHTDTMYNTNTTQYRKTTYYHIP